MASALVQYVHQHPPRCIVDLNPKPTLHSKPTLLLPSNITVYHGAWAEAETASFVIGCPCGNHAVYLLGYYHTTEGRLPDTIFVGPLSLECPKCGVVSEFFDTRKHGYDGEQGVNTHITGEGKPNKFACPHCGVVPMILNPNFTYGWDVRLPGEMQPVQDFFGSFDIVGQCTRCSSLLRSRRLSVTSEGTRERHHR